ncbi:MAG: CRISPR-associated endoribonuclease Cas6 [Thermotoga sp.]|nr:MAG: CRISPR-associated endoribonuclease Cas6 [Thermotoga sp.]
MMRLKVYLSSISKDFFSINYNHFLMRIVYDLISQENITLGKMLHSMNGPKPFTFSRIMLRNYNVEKDRITVYKGTKAEIIISSIEEAIIESIVNTLIKKDFVKIGNARFYVDKFEVYAKNISCQEKFVLLSPIVISKPVDRNGKLYHEFLEPQSDEFVDRFVRNLKKRYEILIGKKAGDVEFIPDTEYINTHCTSKLIDMKGTKIKAHIFPFTLKGDKKLIEFGYYAGFGERTAQGFGCAEVIEIDRKDL